MGGLSLQDLQHGRAMRKLGFPCLFCSEEEGRRAQLHTISVSFRTPSSEEDESNG